MKFDFKWGLICSGQATDTILNNPNMLSHMEGTICGSNFFFFFYKSSIAPFPLTQIRVAKAQCCMNNFRHVSLPINALISFPIA